VCIQMVCSAGDESCARKRPKQHHLPIRSFWIECSGSDAGRHSRAVSLERAAAQACCRSLLCPNRNRRSVPPNGRHQKAQEARGQSRFAVDQPQQFLDLVVSISSGLDSLCEQGQRWSNSVSGMT
jgi:hypothetical protein